METICKPNTGLHRFVQCSKKTFLMETSTELESVTVIKVTIKGNLIELNENIDIKYTLLVEEK